MLRLGGQRTLAVSAAATCKNARAGYPFSSVPQLRARLLVQAPLSNPSYIDGLLLYSSQRSYSSLPPPSPTKPQGSKIEPVFPSSGVARKHKVDLKPAPRTANQASSAHETVQAPTSPALVPQRSQPTSQPNPAAPNASQATGKPPSKVKIAIADVVKAAEQGALAPAPADAGKVGKIWHQVKELFKFYVRGLKQLLVHRQIVKDIKSRIREERAQGVDAKMTWEEAHFVKTYKEDLVKLIPFLLILLIVEEALPLVVLYAPFLLPSTCILPNQRARILWKRDDAQYNARVEARRILSEVGSLQTSVADMPNELVTALAGVFGLSTRGPVALHRRRLEKHLDYVVNDDRLLVAENMGSHLDLRNLKTAMSERGFLASVEEPYLRTVLDKRLQALGEDAAGWKHSSLEFLFKNLLESNRDVKPTPVD